MKQLCIIFVLLAFIFVKPFQLQETGLMYFHVGDDASYFSHATSIAFFNFPSYKNELTSSPAHSIGAGLMAAPFVFLFSNIDRWQEHKVVEKRTEANICQSWSLFGYVVATQCYFLMGVFLLYRSVLLYFNDRVVLVGIVCLVFVQYFPLYLFRRPVLSHIYEFFLQSVFVCLFLNHLKKGRVKSAKFQTIVGYGLLVGMMILVRYNNVLFALMWPIVLLKVQNQNKYDFWRTARRVVPVWSIGLLFFGFFKILPVDQTDSDVYIASTVSVLSDPKPLWFFICRFLYVIGGLDWGFLFTAPFLLMGVGALLLFKDEVSKSLRLVSLPILINVYIVLVWATQGGWYGYRYLFFSLCPLIIFSFCALIKKLHHRWPWCYLLVGFSLIAFVPMISMLSFEGNISTLNLHFIKHPFGQFGWGNIFYHFEIVQHALSEPKALLLILLQGGFTYWFQVASNLMGFGTVVLFNFEILAKSLILYGLPFAVWGLYRFVDKRLKDMMV